MWVAGRTVTKVSSGSQGAITRECCGNGKRTETPRLNTDVMGIKRYVRGDQKKRDAEEGREPMLGQEVSKTELGRKNGGDEQTSGIAELDCGFFPLF